MGAGLSVKVLIAGASGQVGWALQATAPKWTEVVALSRQDLDITDTASVRRTMQTVVPAVVINAAAYTAVDRAESDEEQAYRVNGAAVATLAEICAEHSVRLIHLSTDYVFDGAQTRPYRPDDKPSPQTAYGRSKLAGETAALRDERNLVVRTAWVYGHRGNNFAHTMLRLFAEREEVRVVADQIGTPTHARSLAAAIWALVEQDARGLLHFTDAGQASWYEFAVAIQEEVLALGLIRQEVALVPITIAEYPTLAKRPPYSVLDSSDCWALLGGPARHWRAELREMLAEEKHG